MKRCGSLDEDEGGGLSFCRVYYSVIGQREWYSGGG